MRSPINDGIVLNDNPNNFNLDWLASLRDRWERVNVVANLRDSLNSDTVVRWLDEYPSTYRNILEFDPEETTNAALIGILNQTIPGRFEPRNLVGIAQAPPNGIRTVTRGGEEIIINTPLFLEIGTNTLQSDGSHKGAGLVHILAAHATDFKNRNPPIPENQMVDFLMTALTQGRDIGNQGPDASRVVYEVSYEGIARYVSISVGDNGFIVGANPTPSDLVNDLLNH